MKNLTIRAGLVTGAALLSLVIGTSSAWADTPNSGELSLDLVRDCPVMYDHVIVPGQEDPTWVECTKILQEDLNTLGANVDVDGLYGDATSAAVDRFQTRFAVNARGGAGVADDPTRQALESDAQAKRDAANYDANAGTNTACDIGSDPLGSIPVIGGALQKGANKTCQYVLGQDPAN